MLEFRTKKDGIYKNELNADTLDGYHASDFALQRDLNALGFVPNSDGSITNNANTLEGHNASYFATAASVTNIINGTDKVQIAKTAELVAWGNVIDKPSTYNPSTHTHDYLPLSGGTITGNLKVNTTLNSVNYQENGDIGHLTSTSSSAPSNTNMLWIG